MSDKPFQIGRRTVLEAYKAVKENKGAPGCDGVDFEAFDAHRDNNLYKIWNRMSSGSYFPSPVLAVRIPKKNGKTRTLGIPTIEDRVAQMVVLRQVEPKLDPLFDEDSYGYRPGRSALDAVGAARRRCWEHPYVIELDIKGLFDNIDHELLMKAVRLHIKEPWQVLYIERWLKAPFVDRNGNLTPRAAGTPQGGVISPVLANLFMHYAFDRWMRIHHPDVPFERYADDVLVHCDTREQAEALKAGLAGRLAECRLEMNEEKTRIAYCANEDHRRNEPITSFDFLGYTFCPAYVKCGDGKRRLVFGPRVSRRAEQSLRDKVKARKVHRMSKSTIEQVAAVLNPIVGGWINYFGRFAPSAMRKVLRTVEARLVRWAKRKYKNLRGHTGRAWKWLEKIRKENPGLMVHWQWLYETV